MIKLTFNDKCLNLSTVSNFRDILYDLLLLNTDGSFNDTSNQPHVT
jgi:hypothetical protein